MACVELGFGQIRLSFYRVFVGVPGSAQKDAWSTGYCMTALHSPPHSPVDADATPTAASFRAKGFAAPAPTGAYQLTPVHHY